MLHWFRIGPHRPCSILRAPVLWELQVQAKLEISQGSVWIPTLIRSKFPEQLMNKHIHQWHVWNPSWWNMMMFYIHQVSVWGSWFLWVLSNLQPPSNFDSAGKTCLELSFWVISMVLDFSVTPNGGHSHKIIATSPGSAKILCPKWRGGLNQWPERGSHGDSEVKWPKSRIVHGWVTFLALWFLVHPITSGPPNQSWGIQVDQIFSTNHVGAYELALGRDGC